MRVNLGLVEGVMNRCSDFVVSLELLLFTG